METRGVSTTDGDGFVAGLLISITGETHKLIEQLQLVRRAERGLGDRRRSRDTDMIVCELGGGTHMRVREAWGRGTGTNMVIAKARHRANVGIREMRRNQDRTGVRVRKLGDGAHMLGLEPKSIDGSQ